MHVRMWEIHVDAAHRAEFERIYGPKGAWVALFRPVAGYLGTELLRDERAAERYLVVDRWKDGASFDAFLDQHKREYHELDERCRDITAKETPVGTFVDVA